MTIQEPLYHKTMMVENPPDFIYADSPRISELKKGQNFKPNNFAPPQIDDNYLLDHRSLECNAYRDNSIELQSVKMNSSQKVRKERAASLTQREGSPNPFVPKSKNRKKRLNMKNF